MKRLIFISLCLTIIFSSCKKEEGCTDPIAKNYNIDAESDDGSCDYGSIVGIWKPDSVIIYLFEEEFSLSGELLDSENETYTGSPGTIGLTGENLEFTSKGEAIIPFSWGNYIDTGSYIISGNTLSLFDNDGSPSTVFTYSTSINHLLLSRSMSETDYAYDGTYDILTREETLYLTKQ